MQSTQHSQPALTCCSAGRILNVAVCAADTNEPPRLLNYLTAPNAVVWSAVSCSSAFPGLFQPQDLLAKDHDGAFVRCALFGNLTAFLLAFSEPFATYSLPLGTCELEPPHPVRWFSVSTR